MFDDLPSDLRNLIGQCLDPEALKEKIKDNPGETPIDFKNWGILEVPNKMKLRNKITPESLILSTPAMSLSCSSVMTPPVSVEDRLSTGALSTYSSQRHIKTTGSFVIKDKPVNTGKIDQVTTENPIDHPLDINEFETPANDDNKSVVIFEASSLPASPEIDNVTLTSVAQPGAVESADKSMSIANISDVSLEWDHSDVKPLATPNNDQSELDIKSFGNDDHFLALQSPPVSNLDTNMRKSIQEARAFVADYTPLSPIQQDIDQTTLVTSTPKSPTIVQETILLDDSPVTTVSNDSKLSFSDESGLPIAVDNDKGTYRLSKRHETDPSVKRHIPFDQSTDSNSNQSTSSKSVRRKTPEDAQFQAYVDRLFPKSPPVTPVVAQPVITTPILKRPQRNKRRPAKFNDYDMAT